VTSIRATAITDDHIGVLPDQVNEFALCLIAPVRSNNNHRSHKSPSTTHFVALRGAKWAFYFDDRSDSESLRPPFFSPRKRKRIANAILEEESRMNAVL
jgi:hypothetical protein